LQGVHRICYSGVCEVNACHHVLGGVATQSWRGAAATRIGRGWSLIVYDERPTTNDQRMLLSPVFICAPNRPARVQTRRPPTKNEGDLRIMDTLPIIATSASAITRPKKRRFPRESAVPASAEPPKNRVSPAFILGNYSPRCENAVKTAVFRTARWPNAKKLGGRIQNDEPPCRMQETGKG
jgi:hypothetical protein